MTDKRHPIFDQPMEKGKKHMIRIKDKVCSFSVGMVGKDIVVRVHEGHTLIQDTAVMFEVTHHLSQFHAQNKGIKFEKVWNLFDETGDVNRII